MNISKSELTNTQDLLHAEQQHAAQLLVTLNSKEKILNQTKDELANVLMTAKGELDNLRQQLINASRQLSVCQGNAGLPTTAPAGKLICQYLIVSLMKLHALIIKI